MANISFQCHGNWIACLVEWYFMVITCNKCSSLRLSKSRMTISMMFAQHPATVMTTISGKIQWEPHAHTEKRKKKTKSGKSFTNIKQENRISFRAQNSIIDLLQSCDASESWNCVQFCRWCAYEIYCCYDCMHDVILMTRQQYFDRIWCDKKPGVYSIHFHIHVFSLNIKCLLFCSLWAQAQQ